MRSKIAIGHDECLSFATSTRLQDEMGSTSTSGTENSLKSEYAIPVGYGTRFKEKCVGRIVSGSEKDGMALSYLPQLLDCMPPREG